jgi:hypothetical protein
MHSYNISLSLSLSLSLFLSLSLSLSLKHACARKPTHTKTTKKKRSSRPWHPDALTHRLVLGTGGSLDGIESLLEDSDL